MKEPAFLTDIQIVDRLRVFEIERWFQSASILIYPQSFCYKNEVIVNRKLRKQMKIWLTRIIVKWITALEHFMEIVVCCHKLFMLQCYYVFIPAA